MVAQARPGCAWAGGWWAGSVGTTRIACSATARTCIPPTRQCTGYALQVLTINIHLSPLDYCGCLPSENGLVLHGLDLTMAHLTMALLTTALFTKVLHGLDGCLDPPLMLPTPLGAVAVLWADERGRACFHTAGDLSAGTRVVLNSFWQTPAAATPAPRSPSPPAEAPRDAFPHREVPDAAAAAAGGGTAAFNRATRVEARTCEEGATGLLAAASWLRVARLAGSPLVLRRLGARLPCVREWAAAPAQALAACGGALGVRAFVSSSGRLWLDGSNAPQAVLSASMTAETTLGTFLGGGGNGEGANLAARWAHRYLVENLDGDGDFGSEAACGAAAALRAATCGEATDALLAAFDAPPARQKLSVAAGRIRTQARPTSGQPTALLPPPPLPPRPAPPTHLPTGNHNPPTHPRQSPPVSRLPPVPPTHLRSCSVTPWITSTSAWPGGTLGRWRTPTTRWSTNLAASVPTKAFNNRHAVRATAR